MLMNVKTIFTTNTQNIYQKTIYLTNQTNTITKPNIIVTDENIYKVLADYSIIIQKLLFEFSLGNFQYVTSILTRKYYQYLSIKLTQIMYNDYPIYEQLRITIKYALQGLYKAIQQYQILLETNIKLASVTERASILDDMKKLKEFVKTLKGGGNIFPDLIISAPMAKIKAEYLEYIQLYGYPSNGVFDMDKLGAILISMELNNLI
jgi:hypothetical protein